VPTWLGDQPRLVGWLEDRVPGGYSTCELWWKWKMVVPTTKICVQCQTTPRHHWLPLTWHLDHRLSSSIWSMHSDGLIHQKNTPMEGAIHLCFALLAPHPKDESSPSRPDSRTHYFISKPLPGGRKFHWLPVLKSSPFRRFEERKTEKHTKQHRDTAREDKTGSRGGGMLRYKTKVNKCRFSNLPTAYRWH